MSYSGKFKDKNNNLHPVTSVLYGTCDTAAATAAKVVTCSDFDALMTGVTIRVKFANANTAASPTVNINSTGAKSVYRFGSTAPVDGNSWNAGEVVELVYDGTSFFMTGADDLSVKQNVTDNSLDTTAKTIVGAINEHEGDIDQLKSGLINYENQNNLNLEVPDRKNLFNKDDVGILTGKAVNSQTGEVYNAANWSVSGYIEIEPSTTYTLTATPDTSNSVAFYDSEKAYISGASTFGTKTTPSNAKYLRFDYKSEYTDIMQLELGSTATSYAPYVPSVNSRLNNVGTKVVPLTGVTTDSVGRAILNNEYNRLYKVIVAYSGTYVFGLIRPTVNGNTVVMCLDNNMQPLTEKEVNIDLYYLV